MSDYPDRPPSEQLADLHIYVMPPTLWRQHLKSAVNEVIEDMVSAGFIRVLPEMKILDLRHEIENQLGHDLIPRKFVFLKSVGRCLTQVKGRQELQLKVKNFLPPQAYCPEIFLLEATPEVIAQMDNDTPRSSVVQSPAQSQSQSYPHNHHHLHSRSPSKMTPHKNNARSGYVDSSRGLRPSDRDNAKYGRSSRLTQTDFNDNTDPYKTQNSIGTQHSNEDPLYLGEKHQDPGHSDQTIVTFQQQNIANDSLSPANSGHMGGQGQGLVLPPLSASPTVNLVTADQGHGRHRSKKTGSHLESSASTSQTEGDSGIYDQTTTPGPDDYRRESTLDSLDRRKQNAQRQSWLDKEDVKKSSDEESTNWNEDNRNTQSANRHPQTGRETSPELESPLHGSRIPSPPSVTLDRDETFESSEGRQDTESATQRWRNEKEELLSQLENAKAERKATEHKREELVRRAKQLQSKTNNRRNQARDIWKKRYFEEKKKTPPLEEQCNRLRHEIDVLHRRLLTQLENNGKHDLAKNKPGKSVPPSQKNNYKIQATKLKHDIDELQRRVDNCKMKLTAEMKLRNQAETELRALRAELTQKKINVTLTRSQQMAALGSSHNFAPSRTPGLTPR